MESVMTFWVVAKRDVAKSEIYIYLKLHCFIHD